MSVFRCSICGQINRVKEQARRKPVCGRCKKPLDISGVPQDVNSQALKKAIASSPVPVLLDVWAPWCGPCRMVAPVLKDIGEQRKGELMILKLNSDENQEMSGKLKVSGIPTIVLFEKGKEKARQAGAMPQSALNSWIDANA